MQMENKIVCPVCKSQECNVEAIDKKITAYMCMGCGYNTNTYFVDGSTELKVWEQRSPELIRASKFIDPATKLCWFPSVLNFPTHGLVFPDGKNENEWKWCAAKVIQIPKDEQKNYPIPKKDGEFYDTKVDMENRVTFEKGQFREACIHIGILHEEVKK